MRLVDADNIVAKLKSYYEALSPDVQSELIRRDEVSSCIAELINAPTIDAQPVKHGHWILHFDDLFPEESTIECSVCHEHSSADMPYDNFCPACGSFNGGK
jgi:hypothetical protein